MLGLWVERLVGASADVADLTVIAPVPWIPPGLPGRFGAQRHVPDHEVRRGIPVWHPRIPVAPGYRLHALDARLQYPFIRRAADRLHRERPFQLIHAHFIYPDGVTAARLGRRWGVPVVTTEHALWQPWLEEWPGVRRQVLAVAPDLAVVTVVSEAVGRSVRAVAGDRFAITVVPNVVDETEFPAPDPGEGYDEHQLLFVGAVRHVKGLDVLVHALSQLAARRPRLRLLVLGEAFYGQWRRDEAAVRRLCRELGLEDRVTFAGRTAPAEVAAAMRRSAVLVVPGRRESFSAVAIEALASGTPVVATRSGGPEDIVTRELGRLVPPDDPAALAGAIEEVLRDRGQFDRAALRASAVERFGLAATRVRVASLYDGVLAGARRGQGTAVSAP